MRFVDGVIGLNATPQWLLRAPRDARDLQLATDRVRWSNRQPGPPDPGPAIHRYRPIINIAAVCALLAIVLVGAIRLRRRRANDTLAIRG